MRMNIKLYYVVEQTEIIEDAVRDSPSWNKNN